MTNKPAGPQASATANSATRAGTTHIAQREHPRHQPSQQETGRWSICCAWHVRDGMASDQDHQGSRLTAAGLAMPFKLIESAQDRWRAVNAPHLVALVRAGAVFVNGKLVERPGGDAPPEAA